ncbi:hypothetical protein E4U11_006235 [Claviceps purpurea]|nr:hypothetical protein E4U11_006235 [Claviceps purpurea]
MRFSSPREAVALAFAVTTSLAATAFPSTPLMGYNSYNHLSCSPSDTSIRNAINGLASRGFVAAGYTFFQIDCGWASRDGQRNASNGALKIDLHAFPNGLQPLSDLARSKGMRWSMYSDAGVRMCDPQVPSPVLGSSGKEAADAALFKTLNTEYVKYDYCYADGPAANQNAPKGARTDFITRYSAMWKELQRVGIPGMLICQWGTPYSSQVSGATRLQGPNQWTRGISTSFRFSDDIGTGWGNVYRIYNQAVHVARSGLVGPGHIPDADLLEVGNPGMTFDEQATHFAMWAMLKSSLMVSTDPTALSNQMVAVLQNKHLIAMNQDSAVKPIQLVQRWTSDRDVWMGSLANGDLAVLVVDLSNRRRTLTLNFADIGVASAAVLDAWTGVNTAGVSVSYSKTVNGRGSLALRLSGVKYASSSGAAKYNYFSVASGALSAGAKVVACSGCSSSKKVSYLGGAGAGRVVLSNIRTSQATQKVRFDYVNGDVCYLGGGSNERVASIRVNGGAEQVVSFPLSGYDWERDVYQGYVVELSGFNVHGTNTISISGSGTGWAPDLDRVGVVA